MPRRRPSAAPFHAATRAARAALVAAALAAPLAAGAQDQLVEGFDAVASLAAGGWSLQNLSHPVGATGWYQGSTPVFDAATGAADSYVAANYNSTDLSGTISNWLITPVLSLADGLTFSFQTRTATGSQWADRLEVRLSTSGTSTNVGSTATSVGDFTTLLLSVNESLAPTGYPQTWTTFTVTLAGLAAPAEGRLAFRYSVPNGGALGNNSNYIGIDDLRVGAAPMSAVPEPSTVALLASGVLVLGGVARRRRTR